MLRSYATNHSVTSAVTSWMRESDETRQEFSSQSLHQHFTAIDKGLVAYLRDEHGTSNLTAVQDAITAYYKIYASTLPFVDRLARYFGRTYPDFTPDFFQAAATENLRVLQEFEGGRSLELCEHFYSRVQATTRGTILSWLTQAIRHEKGLTLSQYQKKQTIQEVQRTLQLELKRDPSIDEIVNKLDNAVSPATVQALLNADNYVLNLDIMESSDPNRENPYGSLPIENTEAEFDQQLDQWAMEEASQRVFDKDSPLNDLEKIVLSLYYEVFSPHLRGAEYHHRPVKGHAPTHSFVYPMNLKEFTDILRAASPEHVKDIQQKHVTRILGATQSGISNILIRALKKSRILYEENDELALLLKGI
jgi:DNA-directed RNA polymerase specialized sigma subunit